MIEPRLELSEDTRRQRGPFAGGFVNGQWGGKSPLLIELEPGLDGMPMDGQQFDQRQPGGRLTASKQVERLETGVRFRVGFRTEQEL
jgi:hypothetical protein